MIEVLPILGNAIANNKFIVYHAEVAVRRSKGGFALGLAMAGPQVKTTAFCEREYYPRSEPPPIS